MTPRTELPHRRPTAVLELSHNGQPFILSLGIHPETGAILDAFADPERYGSDFAHILADACVVVSLALQYGCPPEALQKSLGHVPDPINGEDATRPASIIGTICATLAKESLHDRR